MNLSALTRSALIAMIAILLRLLQVPGARAEKIAQLFQSQHIVAALVFASILIAYVVQKRSFCPDGEDPEISEKRLQMLEDAARDLGGFAVRMVKKHGTTKAALAKIFAALKRTWRDDLLCDDLASIDAHAFNSS